MKYKAAVIGLGRMGSTFDDEMWPGTTLLSPYCHGPTYHSHPAVDLVAGADPHDEQRVIFGRRWGLSPDHLYADYRDMLVREEPDIVSVCTSARFRPPIVQDIARAGVKIIWAEKPISISLAEGDSMVRVCREEGTTLAINCARRWWIGFSGVRDIIDSGEMGKVLQVTAHFPCGLSQNGSHLIDAIRFLAGGSNVEWVFGEIESDESAGGELDVSGNGYFAFDNGVRAFIRTMPCGDSVGNIYEVIGERGRIHCEERPAHFEFIRFQNFMEVEDNHPAPPPRSAQPAVARYQIPLPPKVDGLGITALNDIIAAHEEGRPPRVSGEDGLQALEIAIAMRESHRRGGVKVTLPLEDRSQGLVAAESNRDDIPARLRRAKAG